MSTSTWKTFSGRQTPFLPDTQSHPQHHGLAKVRQATAETLQQKPPDGDGVLKLADRDRKQGVMM
jgi:hypothetical protein